MKQPATATTHTAVLRISCVILVCFASLVECQVEAAAQDTTSTLSEEDLTEEEVMAAVPDAWVEAGINTYSETVLEPLNGSDSEQEGDILGDSIVTAAPPPVGTLVIGSIPDSASIYINSKELGRTNTKYRARVGYYRVRVFSAADSLECADEIEVLRDQITTFGCP